MPDNGGQPPARRLFSCPAFRRSPINGSREPAPVGLPPYGGVAYLAGASRGRFLPGRVISPERRPLIWQVASHPSFLRRRQTTGVAGPGPGVLSLGATHNTAAFGTGKRQTVAGVFHAKNATGETLRIDRLRDTNPP